MRTPRLELLVPEGEVLDELAAVAAGGVHDPADMPFLVPWTDGTPEDRARATFQHVLATVAECRPEKWNLSVRITSVRDEARMLTRLRVTREDWLARRSVRVEVTGLEPCRGLLGA